MGAPLDLSGQRFDRLVVLSTGARDGFGNRTWRVRCTCGNERTVSTSKLRNGNTRSCGCLRSDRARARAFAHGDAVRGNESHEYMVWKTMIARCHNKASASFRLYGARGIKVCARWRKSFAHFLSDMGRRPSKAHQIDRQNNNGNYTPKNCAWRTRREQMSNTTRNVFLTHEGVRLCVAEWSRLMKVPSATIIQRLRAGRSVPEALSNKRLRRRPKALSQNKYDNKEIIDVGEAAPTS